MKRQKQTETQQRIKQVGNKRQEKKQKNERKGKVTKQKKVNLFGRQCKCVRTVISHKKRKENFFFLFNRQRTNINNITY